MRELLVIDCETTGRNSQVHEIIEIAWLRCESTADGWKIRTSEEYKIKPGKIELAEDEALAINGYDPSEWTDEATTDLSIVLRKLNDAMTGVDRLLGHNLIFDLRFLSEAYERENIVHSDFPSYYDTRAEGEDLKRRGLVHGASLSRLCRHFDVNVGGRSHTALIDCEMTVGLFNVLESRSLPYPILIKFWTYQNPFISPSFSS